MTRFWLSITTRSGWRKFFGIKRTGIGAQLLPAHGQRRIVRQHGGAAGQDGMALGAQTLHVASRLREVIHWLSPLAIAVRPSSEAPSFSCTVENRCASASESPYSALPLRSSSAHG